MKKNLLTIAFCMALCAFMSCTKERAVAPTQEPSTEASAVDNELINEVISLNSYTERKAAYTNILSAAERYAVWARRSQDILNSGVLNAQQTALFKQAAAKLSLSIFTSKTERFGLTSFFEDWKTKARKVFTEAQLKYLISDVAKFNKDAYLQIGVSDDSKLAASYQITSESGKVCGCSTRSDWCGSQGDCMSVDDCTANGYCGTFLVYECDGMCSLVIIDQQNP